MNNLIEFYTFACGQLDPGNLLFRRNVSFGYRCALHIRHLHMVLNLIELQPQVLTPDGHQRPALARPPQRSYL